MLTNRRGHYVSRRDRRFSSASPFLSRAQVMELVGVNYTTLWRWMRDGEFPRARVLSPGEKRNSCIAWLKSEVDAWVASRPTRTLKAPDEVVG